MFGLFFYTYIYHTGKQKGVMCFASYPEPYIAVGVVKYYSQLIKIMQSDV